MHLFNLTFFSYLPYSFPKNGTNIAEKRCPLLMDRLIRQNRNRRKGPMAIATKTGSKWGHSPRPDYTEKRIHGRVFRPPPAAVILRYYDLYGYRDRHDDVARFVMALHQQCRSERFPQRTPFCIVSVQRRFFNSTRRIIFPRLFHDSCHETQKNTMFHSV